MPVVYRDFLEDLAFTPDATEASTCFLVQILGACIVFPTIPPPSAPDPLGTPSGLPIHTVRNTRADCKRPLRRVCGDAGR